MPTTIKPYSTMYGTYGSDLRDEAMILETLTLLGQQAKAATQLRAVAARLSQDDWYSTQTTAYSLIAIAQYCGQNKSSGKLAFSYQGTSLSSQSYIWQSGLAVNGGKVTLKNQGTNRLYVRLIPKRAAFIRPGCENFYRSAAIANACGDTLHWPVNPLTQHH